MEKTDFKKGQIVYLFVIEGSNAYRNIKNKPFSERIKQVTVTCVGRKYVTVDMNGWPIQFDIEENFQQVCQAGGADYAIFLDEQSIYDYQESEELYAYIRSRFDNWRNQDRFSLEQLRKVKEIIECKVYKKALAERRKENEGE